jgi:hypothetical protein
VATVIVMAKVPVKVPLIKGSDRGAPPSRTRAGRVAYRVRVQSLSDHERPRHDRGAPDEAPEREVHVEEGLLQQILGPGGVFCQP